MVSRSADTCVRLFKLLNKLLMKKLSESKKSNEK